MGYIHTGAILITESFLGDVRRFPRDESNRFDCPSDYKASRIIEAENILRLGVPLAIILQSFKESEPNDSYRFYTIRDYLEHKNIELPCHVKYPRDINECITIGQFYYHPLLQETVGPPRTIIDWTTMEMTNDKPEPFFLEIKDSFTLENLVDYFIQKTKSEEELHQKKRLIGQFKTAVDRYGIDFTLYLIDASVADAEEKGKRMPRSLGDLLDNLPEAKAMIEMRKSVCLEGGLNRVYPKYRT